MQYIYIRFVEKRTRLWDKAQLYKQKHQTDAMRYAAAAAIYVCLVAVFRSLSHIRSFADRYIDSIRNRIGVVVCGTRCNKLSSYSRDCLFAEDIHPAETTPPALYLCVWECMLHHI